MNAAPAQLLERPLPNSADAERAILGAIILDNALISQAIELLKPEDFYVSSHRRVFLAMISLFERGSEINPILIAEELRREGEVESVGGLTFISNLTYGLPVLGDIAHYAEIVRKKSLTRQLVKASNKIAAEALEEDDEPEVILDRAEQAIFSLSGQSRLAITLRNNQSVSLPMLSPKALHGLAGDFVRTVEPHTEADPAALLVQFLVAFGNCAGRAAHFAVESDLHRGNLFAVLVGATASGRKGTSWGYVRRCFENTDEDWARNCVASGLSSGEGLIWSVRDPIEQRKPVRDKGRATGQFETSILDQGVEDKRALIIESEFASVLRAQGREGNTLSAVIRQAWDSGNLRSLVKNSPARSTDAHISIIGHITNDELQKCLDGSERFNGYVNRFLWAISCRSKFLPEGGKIQEENFSSIVRRLKSSLDLARRCGEIQRDEGARALWHEVYPDLTAGRGGLLGAVTARAAPQVVRLSMLYALLDFSETVGRVHLEAALALWKYSEDSCRYIFGMRTGDQDADTILQALRTAGMDGLRQTGINGLFHGHRTRDEIGRVLTMLSESGLVKSVDEETTGRPAKRWFAVMFGAEKAEKAKKGQAGEAFFAFFSNSQRSSVNEIAVPPGLPDEEDERLHRETSEVLA